MATTGKNRQPRRPNLVGTRHVIVAGHYLASQAGFQILEAGGNAVDAGVAAGIALGVVEPEMVSFSGVAPIVIYLAETREVITISGLGCWPKAASCEFFQRRFGGEIPKGIFRATVPAAADAWITALERYGTMSFADVASAAIRLAREGFVMYPLAADRIRAEAEFLPEWPANAAIFLPGGRPPEVGDVFVQTDLAATLQFLADEEKAAGRGGRLAGLEAVRHAFYRGDVAARIVAFHGEAGGLLTAEDLADFRVGIEPPVRTRFGDIEVYGCGPWCQGPMLLQELNILEGMDLVGMGHNSAAYLHAVIEAIKLAAADRHAYYGDPKFVEVPMAELLDKGYAARRRALIDPGKAWPTMPPAGEVKGGAPAAARGAAHGPRAAAVSRGTQQPDTSYTCVVDRWGNALSATPSDGNMAAPIVPGTGLAMAPRGVQSWTDPAHPSAIAPGKRPRLTPNPALALRAGDLVMPFGTPGHDVQTQMMLQVFLNVAVFGMDPQNAVEAPRVATHSFPSSSSPHEEEPASLYIEGNTPREIADALARLGHRLHWWPEHGPENTSQDIAGVCLIRHDLKTGVKTGGADPRRMAYALGW